MFPIVIVSPVIAAGSAEVEVEVFPIVRFCTWGNHYCNANYKDKPKQ